MADVTEVSVFDSGIYQLEINDPVEGGALGISNKQAKGLANRTRYLYDQIITLFKYAPKNIGYFTGLDVGGTQGNLSRSGNVTSATVTSTSGNSFITVNLQVSMGNTNYIVESSVQSIGVLNSDNDISKGVFKPISATQFQIAFREIDGVNQNLRVHIKVISLD
mgnify:CR=1 FL=1